MLRACLGGKIKVSVAEIKRQMVFVVKAIYENHDMSLLVDPVRHQQGDSYLSS